VSLARRFCHSRLGATQKRRATRPCPIWKTRPEALPLVPATAPLFPVIDVLGIGSAEAAAGLVITLGCCHRHERADLGYVPTIGHGQRPGHFLLQLLDALLNGSVIGSVEAVRKVGAGRAEWIFALGQGDERGA